MDSQKGSVPWPSEYNCATLPPKTSLTMLQQFDLILGEDVIHRDAMQGLHRSSIQEEKEARVEGTED